MGTRWTEEIEVMRRGVLGLIRRGHVLAITVTFSKVEGKV